MGWPLSQDYNEAIQSPGTSFADPDLRRGQVGVNALGLPRPRSGNFADVYEVSGPGGARWAVKCFTREVAGLHERYQEISRHLRSVQLPFAVDFTFLEQGIRVRGRWYPVLKMQWVEGLTLNEFARQYADKPAMLEALLQIWVRLAGRLRTARIAHGDLQHGNLLLVPSSATSLAAKLIDYDGMFVPALAGRASGEVGHPCYQHPQRARERAYGPEVDRFPFLLIATGLACLKVGGRSLWEKYDSGDNLLFREADLQAPVKSPLFYDLLKLGEPRSRRLVEQTLEALRGDLARAPLLEEALPELHTSPYVTTAPPASASRTSIRRRTPAMSGLRRIVVRRAGERHSRGRLVAVVVGGVAFLVLLGCSLVWSFGSRSEPAPAAGTDETSAAVARKVPPKSTAREKAETPTRPKLTENESPPRPKDKPTDKPKPDTLPRPTENPRPPKPVPTPASPKMPAAGTVVQNSIGMKLAYIPAGKFRMGTSAEEMDRYKKLPNPGYTFPGDLELELPQHEVRITRGFYLGVYEVTQAEYEKVIGSNPSAFKESPSHPVDSITWPKAVEFCKRLSERAEEKQAGRTYRLPTEAEWEYACRAGTTTAFHYGDSLSPDQANFKSESPFGDSTIAKKPSLKKTVKVGSYPPNAWGLYDMHGNLWEWCQDDRREYTPKPVDDPLGPESGPDRVLRGGSWSHAAVRSAYRKSRDAAKYGGSICGLRVLCELKAPGSDEQDVAISDGLGYNPR